MIYEVKFEGRGEFKIEPAVKGEKLIDVEVHFLNFIQEQLDAFIQDHYKVAGKLPLPYLDVQVKPIE